MNFENQLFMECNINYKMDEYSILENKDKDMIVQIMNKFNGYNYKNFEELENEIKTQGIDSKFIVKYGKDVLENNYVYLKDKIPVKVPYILMNRTLGEHLSFVHNLIKRGIEKGTRINLFVIPQFLNLDFFLTNYDKFNLEQKRYMFDYLYQGLETDFDKFTVDIVKECSVLSKEDRETLQEFCNEDNELIIYRGINDLSTHIENAYSWTLSKKIAQFFASRLQTGTGRILKGKINLDNVIGYKDDGEEEVICLYQDVELLE